MPGGRAVDDWEPRPIAMTKHHAQAPLPKCSNRSAYEFGASEQYTGAAPNGAPVRWPDCDGRVS